MPVFVRNFLQPKDMSQNKFMHPRNIYRKPPSFKELAIQYPEFRKVAKQDLSGKISIDFKDPESLRALTCSLLHKDFGLQVDIPVNRLVPTLPLRLNYLLWLEDLLEAAACSKERYFSVKGIDIGTGASCIYPLLAAKMNGWHMIATEVDGDSISIARQNVEKNNLQALVTVKRVESETLLKNVVETQQEYTFSMCNPPFFSSEQELDYVAKSRSVLRTPPHNAATGDIKELVAPGGEIAFITRMMDESKELNNAVRIYTTMIGHKSSLGKLKLKLEALKVTNVAETRFCQGNTTRWGLAWTFENNLNLNTNIQIASKKKSSTPMSYIVPEGVGTDYSLEGVVQRVLKILEELKIKYKKLKENKYMDVFEVTAASNTWSHQRRKRRSQKDSAGEEANASKMPELTKQIKRASVDDGEGGAAEKRLKKDSDEVVDDELSETPSVSERLQTSRADAAGTETLSSGDNGNCSGKPGGSQGERKTGMPEDCSRSPLQAEPSGALPLVPVLEATLVVRRVESQICVEILWQGGTGGRDAMHQVMQFLKNKLR